MLSQFASWPRWAAIGMLLGTFALITYGVTAPPFPMPTLVSGSDSTRSDLALYGAVLNRVTAGEDYYQAAASEQRARGYPLRPFVTVRPPVFTQLAVAAGGRRPMARLLDGLVVLATIAMVLRLLTTIRTRALTVAASLCALTFLTVRHVPIFWYETWCAALVLLSLACWSERTWAVSLLFGLLAALMRELAAPYLCVMLAIALYERRRNEAIGWCIALGVFAASLTLHASRVHAISTLADKASPGWLRAGGWPFILRIVHESSAMIITPIWLVAMVVPLALLGWAGWKHPIAHRATLYLCGFIAAFMVVGRQNTAYWGMLLTSLLFVGLAFAPSALVTLARRARAPAPV